ncbi:putative hsp70 protein [Lyophyllum shimeji]|uniref:Hsp70 protein n=1 Tax=Lyophyllum shimeji TaxID=47721 RepID=A0A9P3UR15_LYOSH|nr:putative hsp70 protein [Lyophyllum shimeji]
MSTTPVPNGSAVGSSEGSSLPPIVGINFGNSYASIAVFTKEGVAECIANEEGERQIACAISFQGEEIYIGNQATHQLVKNAKNTITGFRNLLGKKFSEIPQSQLQSTKSAPVIQHPDIPDEPAYKVQILQPAPSPLPPSTQPSAFTTPAASQAATPRSEPVPAERILTVSEVNTMFLASLVESAENFLGKKGLGAVITVPTAFTEAQKDALEKAATDAGVHVLQLLDEAGAAAVTTTSDIWAAELPADRTQLIVDLGSSSLALTLLSIRSGLAFVLASSHTTSVGGDQIDEKLIRFFAADFTKKTKVPLAVCPATDIADQRAEARLRLAIEHTKRTISASPGAATCSVESLKDGLDYTGSINRLRFDLLARPVYSAVADAVKALLESAQVDAHHVDELVYVGGSASLPGLDEALITDAGFAEDVATPFARGTVVGGGVGDPTTVLARGCAVQGALLASIPDDERHREVRAAYQRGGKGNEVQATQRTVGVLVPGAEVKVEGGLGGVWIPVVHKETALPARRTVRFDVELAEDAPALAFEVWEVTESIRVEKITAAAEAEADEEEPEEEPEEVEVKHKEIKKEVFLGAVQMDAKLGIKTKGKSTDSGKTSTTVEVQCVIETSGALRVDVKEVGEGGAAGSLRVPAPGA